MILEPKYKWKRTDIIDCDYVIETYVDPFKTLSQSIMYKYGDNRDKDYLRTTINPNLTILHSIRYLKKTKNLNEPLKLIYEERFIND